MLATTLMRRNGNQGNGWNPLDAFRREVESWMGGNYVQDGKDLVGSYPVDIHEDENFIHVEAELPGFKKEEIEVTLDNSILNIQAQRKAASEKQGDAHLIERRYTRVARAFTLPNTVDGGKVEATLTDGVLHLKLHKREEVKPRKIAVM